ncbi:MAG: response regulator transcription factor [Myxococcales bacterium]|nr:response regulator transcription factor [Myxococcales bacterium]MCB9693696.1 response regulator transcription factor [Alphaproteobacteria bacterium]
MADLLVVDDDARIRELLVEYLSGRGHTVQAAPDGEQGLARLRAGGVDLVVLDIMMPGKDGLQVLRELRPADDVPVILLTARGDDLDRIVGLELGADDYLAKPFHPRELAARIDAVLRRARGRPDSDGPLVAGPLRVDPDRRQVLVDGVEVRLTSTEFDILRALVGNAGRVIPRESLMELARGEAFASFERSIDVHVSNLRRKLGDRPGAPVLIQTVRGVGYVVPREPELP